MAEPKTNINWYPGHMAKTKREINETLPLIDLVFEIVDSRIPESSRIEDIDKIIKNKPRIMIMTKKDLCDLEETKKWIKKYEEQGMKVILVNLNDNSDLKFILSAVKEVSESINAKRVEKGLKEKDLRALVVGIPNVGKSTFINRMAGKKVAGVGNTPGVTKNLVWLKTKANLLLLDTPGILWPKFESEEVACNLAAMSAIKMEVYDNDKVAIHILNKLSNYYPKYMEARYGIDYFDNDDIGEMYDRIGKRLGYIIRGGEIDYARVSTSVINDIRNENIKGITFDRL